MEKLSISNFAGLKEVSLKVAPVTGFIGPQASGKSVIAKLLYFFRGIASRLPAAVIDGMGASEYQATCRKRFIHYFPVDNTTVSDFQITYSANRETVTVVLTKHKTSGHQDFRLEWSGFYSAALEEFAGRKQQLMAALGEADKDAVQRAQEALRREYYEKASIVLGSWSMYHQFFIPAGRAFFSQVQASVFTKLESGESLDPFMVAFGSLLEQSKVILNAFGFFDSGEFDSTEYATMFGSLRAACKEILHAELVRTEDQDFLQFDDGRRVKLAQASFGQQEVLPLLLLLAQFASIRHSRGRVVYIEEPEAHLFPVTQKQTVELMARAFRASDGEMSLVITTHSPYILTSINNLLQAGKLYGAADPPTKRKLNQILPESNSFKPGEVAFYALEDGHAKSILDPETGLIDATAIDQVSDDIAVQFDELLAEANEKS